ncbi:MAG: aminotransferase class I/II-fold pyridoxal phosphate-dependent enzyme [Rhizobiaceae bacterium]
MTKSANASHFLSIRSQVEPFHAMDVLAEANRLQKDGIDIDYLCVGQPAAQAPLAARRAAVELIENGSIGYTDAGGRRDLRERLAVHMQDMYETAVDPSCIFITTGSSAGFMLAFLTLFDAGDRVAIAAPGYPAYRNILKALGLEVVEIKTHEADRWAVTPQQVEDLHREKPIAGILIASPANPTGTMMTPQALEQLIHCCEDLDIRFISDEIYHGLTYAEATGVEAATALQFSDRVVVINSFSKYYCMTGWRIGWMILPPDCVRSVERLSQSLYISAPEMSQVAAMHALDSKQELEKVRFSYLTNRQLLLDRLPQLGFEKIMPIDGAFYAYADATRHTNDTMEFARQMLANAHVAVTPGLDFDQGRGHRYLRFSFAGDTQTMESALKRMEAWLD